MQAPSRGRPPGDRGTFHTFAVLKPISVPVGPISLRSALAKHADVLAPVHRGALEALAAFATDPNQAARLRRLASPDGKAEFQAWAVGPGRTLLEAMQEFPSATPPLGKPPSLETIECANVIEKYRCVGGGSGRTLPEAMQEFPSAPPPLSEQACP